MWGDIYPARVKDDYNSNSDASLTVEISMEEYEQLSAVVNTWKKDADQLTKQYNVYTQNCIDFVRDVAGVLQRIRQPHGHFMTPGNFIDELKRLNREIGAASEQSFRLNEVSFGETKAKDLFTDEGSDSDKTLVKERTLAYFKWLNEVWNKSTTPQFNLLTPQNEINWKEIDVYLGWLDANCPFFDTSLKANMLSYFREVGKKWSLVPKKSKLNTEGEGPFEEIFADWFPITRLNGSYVEKYDKILEPGKVMNITSYPNDEMLVSIPRKADEGGKNKDLDLLWKKEGGEWKVAFTEFMMPRWKNPEYQKKWKAFYGHSRY
jgi:hypothetical protein